MVVALVAGQLLLPELAERRVRSDLAATGDVREVDVSAFPALKLLFGRADEVRVRFGTARSDRNRLGEWIERADGAERLDVRAEQARLGPLEVRDAVLRKDGDAITATGTATREAIEAAAPDGFGVRVEDAEGGELRLRVAVGPVTAIAGPEARNGGLVVAAAIGRGHV